MLALRALALALSCIATGCGPCGVGSVITGELKKRDAEKVADAYFACAREKRYDDCMALYSPKFFEAVPKETWLKILPNIEAELGPLESCKQTFWRAGRYAGTSGSRSHADLTYACKHAKYEATVAFRITDEGEEPKILVQNYNSIGFLIE